MLSESLLLAALLGTGTEVAPPAESFRPATAEVAVDDDGTVEVLVFDDDGAMLGALLVVPTDEHIQLDASFLDGYASLELVLDPNAPPRLIDSDLATEEVVDRVFDMLAMVPPTEGPLEHVSRRQCMWLLAGAAGTCGLGAALSPTGPAAAFAVWACFAQAGGALCSCSEYLPLEIC